MRPVKLVMQAFGPFAERQELDFRPAMQAGLFGIYGPTGAGKSTIFNAITFALFGETARDADHAARTATRLLRAGHAPPELLTEVSFVFELNERTYHIRRIPDQERPKKRGEGVTTQDHAAWLFDATGMAVEDITTDNPGRPLAERKVQHVRAAIEELLGYGPDEFRRIVLLPQGQFERFLLADTSQRMEILRELFDMDIYRQLVEQLRQQARDLQQQVRNRREVLQHRLCAENCERLADLKQLINCHASELQRLERMHQQALARWQAAQDSLQQAQALARRIQELEGLRQKLRHLQERLPHMQRLRQQLQRARQARQAVDLENQLHAAKSQMHKAQQHLQQCRRQMRATAEQADLLARKVEEAERKLRIAEEELASVRRQLRHRLQLQGQLAALQAELAQAREHAAASRRLQQAEQHCRQARRARDAARNDLARAEQAFEQAQQALLQAQAVHLAQHLQPGSPCPVCGARRHPAPASGAADAAALRQKLDQAREALHAARQHAHEADTALAAAESRRQERQRQLQGMPRPACSLDELQDRHTRLQEELATLPGEQAEQEAERRHRQARAELDRHRAAASQAAQARAAALAALDAAQQAAEEARQRHQHAETAFLARLQEQQLTPTTYEELKPLFATLDDRQREADAFFEELQLLQRQVREMEEQLPHATPPDLQPLHEAERRAQAELERVRDAAARARTRHDHLAALHEELAGEERQLQELERSSGPLLRLADELAGNNALKMDLQAYAIGTMFDRVLQAANRRLHPMSRGRYHLQRALQGSRRARRGLDLEVFDAHTGRPRPVHTLSGGETFMAALALALGLADVVESAHARVRLDTIFIDEGFGALDAEDGAGTLEQVLDTLRQLAGTRRVVGVISHVEQVKEAIPAGFDILPSPHGSSIRVREGLG